MNFKKVNITYQPGSYVRALDGIRGLAIFIVMIYHVFIIPGGWAGVDLFFVLSGFLITGILLDAKGRAGYLKNFYTRRALRIFPLYYFSLALFYLLVPAVYQGTPMMAMSKVFFEDMGYYGVFLQNWAQIIRIEDYQASNAVLMHFWSLAIEEQFYLVWPFVILLLGKKQLVRLSLAFVVFALALKVYFYVEGAHWMVFYLNTFTRMDSLAIGALIAIVVRDPNLLGRVVPLLRMSFYVLTVVVMAGLMIFLPIMPADPFFSTIGHSLLALFFGTLLMYGLSNHHGNRLRRFLERRWLVFLGKYSYAIYIFHVPLVTMYRIPFMEWLAPYLSHEMSRFFIGGILCVLIAVVASQVTWVLLEKPMLSLKKVFTHKRASVELA